MPTSPNKPRIYLSPPHMGGDELKFIKQAFETNWIAPLGPNVDGFEADLARYTGAKYVAALSSGTAAIHLALILLGIEAGDEVLCQSFTFSASVNPVMYQHATPILIDSELETWNMDPNLLEEAIKNRLKKGKKPKAIIIVHLYGMPAKIDEIMEIANKYEIPVIEDAAEALGAKYNNQHVGTFGVMGILSFNGNKIITTSGGGALISNVEDYIIRARFLAAQARDPAPHYQHSSVGYNYRMSNIIAGIGRGQMCVLEERIKQRREIYEIYYKELSNFDGIYFLPEPENTFSNRWLTTMIVDSGKTGGITREDIRLALAENNIEARPLWKPMHIQPVYEKMPQFLNGNSEKLFMDGLCLPSGSNLSEANMERILNVIKKLFE
ncbi:DegT/DnrJ/EryC1/StrS family aminotransferase [Calditrichota bacterium GD2]